MWELNRGLMSYKPTYNLQDYGDFDDEIKMFNNNTIKEVFGLSSIVRDF